jgi:hypothetical protein
MFVECHHVKTYTHHIVIMARNSTRLEMLVKTHSIITCLSTLFATQLYPGFQCATLNVRQFFSPKEVTYVDKWYHIENEQA